MSGASVIGVVVVVAIVIFVASQSGAKRGRARKGPLAELVAAVHGDTAVASRLVNAELARSPEMSTEQAASMALKRLLADRRR